MMSSKLVHDIHVIDPLSVAIYSSDVRIVLALLPDLPPQQAIVDGVLHLDTIRGSRKVRDRKKERMRKSSDEASFSDTGGETRGQVQSGGTISRCGPLYMSISALSQQVCSVCEVERLAAWAFEVANG